MKGRLVKTVEFGTYRDVGDPISSSAVYNSQYADELVFLNIDRDGRSVDDLLRLIEKVSEVCFMPLSFGGGIKSRKDAELLIRNGADKVVVNSSVFANPGLIGEIAGLFGSQAVVVSVDVRFDSVTKTYSVYSHCGTKRETVALSSHIETLCEQGAGEIFINSIDCDGKMTGYDLSLIQEVVRVSKIPVIACGGAGNYEHLKEAFVSTAVSALACGSLFNFGDNNPIRAKAFLSNYGLPFKKI